MTSDIIKSDEYIYNKIRILVVQKCWTISVVRPNISTRWRQRRAEHKKGRGKKRNVSGSSSQTRWSPWFEVVVKRFSRYPESSAFSMTARVKLLFFHKNVFLTR